MNIIKLEIDPNAKDVIKLRDKIMDEVFASFNMNRYLTPNEPKPDPINPDLLAAIKEGISSLT